jgi:urea carboxylase system permease
MGDLRGKSARLSGSAVGQRVIESRSVSLGPRAQTDDLRDLASFGYRQQLDRSLGSFSSFAAGFSYISILTGVPQMFHLGFAAAGPAFFWTWPVVLIGQFAVALCFAELASHFPLSGGVYQWSKRIGSPVLGWMTGWTYLACSVVSLAAVALALQATLPQLSPVFQLVGDGASPTDRASNAVILGCALIALTTVINAVGVRLMARINNLGVFTELIGVVLLVVLLFSRARRGPEILSDTQGRAGTGILGCLGPFLAAAVMPSYVMYGFDTAGTLAEETRDPRRRAPWAIVQALGAAGVAGALLIVGGLLAAPDLTEMGLGEITGGLPSIIKQVLDPPLGNLFLVAVVFAVSVCALAVHAGTVRLIFAMARDGNLPFARTLALVPQETRTPTVPALATGALAAIILVLNFDLPRIIETLCAVAIIWANLAYLLVTCPLLIKRLRGWPPTRSEGPAAEGTPVFRPWRWGLVINLIAVAWGSFTVINMSWPRVEIYGVDPWGRYAAVLATAILTLLGLVYYLAVQKRRTGVLAEHAAQPLPTLGASDLAVSPATAT